MPQPTNLGNVLPIKVSDAWNEDRESNTLGLDRGIASEARTDDSAVVPIDTHVPPTGSAKSKVRADVLDET
jgi:hypothetical protein